MGFTGIIAFGFEMFSQTTNNHCIPMNEVNIDQLISDAEDNMFLSPIKASDHHFKKFPPTAILVSTLLPFIRVINDL